GGSVGQGLASLGQSLSGIAEMRQRQEVLDMQKQRMQQEAQQAALQQQQADSQQQARATLYGGFDPTTGISWNTGRQGMDPAQERALMARGYPQAANQAAAAMLTPKEAPKQERFEVKQGDKIKTFVGVPGDPNTWQEVASASRSEPQPETYKLFSPKGDKEQTVRVDSTTERALLGKGWSMTPSDSASAPFSGAGMEAQAYNKLLSPDANPATPEYAVAYNAAFGPKTVTQADGTTITIQPTVPQGIRPPAVAAPQTVAGAAQQPMTPNGAPAAPEMTSQTVTTPGAEVTFQRPPQAPKPQSSEAAARGALVREGVSSVETVESGIFPDGKFDRWAVSGMWAAVPGTAGATLRNAMENAIGNRLRIETGAAATEEETQKLVNRYLPRPWDNEETVRQKINGLRSYFGDFEALTTDPTKLEPVAPRQQAAPQGRQRLRLNPSSGKLEPVR
ncbi:MAG: hypothetical protein RIC38_10540, partial [Chromatocurvus sp.]